MATGEHSEEKTHPPAPGWDELGFRWWFFLVIIAVSIGLLISFSIRNAHQFFLVFRSGKLVVREGVFAPAGTRLYTSSDKKLARLYRPFVVPATWQPQQYQHKTIIDYPELDEALYELLLGLIEKKSLSAEDPVREQKQALRLLRRLRQLPTIQKNPRRLRRIQEVHDRLLHLEGEQILAHLKKRLLKVKAALVRLQEDPKTKNKKRLHALQGKIRRILLAYQGTKAPPPSKGTSERRKRKARRLRMRIPPLSPLTMQRRGAPLARRQIPRRGAPLARRQPSSRPLLRPHRRQLPLPPQTRPRRRQQPLPPRRPLRQQPPLVRRLPASHPARPLRPTSRPTTTPSSSPSTRPTSRSFPRSR